MMKHRMLRRLGALLLALVLAFPAAAAPAFADDPDTPDPPPVDPPVTESQGPVIPTVPAETVVLKPETLELTVGGPTKQLTATITPENADRTLTWMTTNAAVARVENGIVTPVGAGTAYIYANAASGVGSNMVKVTVTEPPTAPTRISLPSSVSIGLGGSQKLTLTTTPAVADLTGLTWTSSNPTIATVDQEGTVSALSMGTTTAASTVTITATIKDPNGKELTAKCTVRVVKATQEASIKLNKTAITLATGGTETLTVTFTPSNTTNKTVVWRSDNAAVASVDAEGKITAGNPGEANITAISSGGQIATCKVTVGAPISSFTFTGADSSGKVSLNLTGVGQHNVLHAQVNPVAAAPMVDKNAIVWTSSNTGVVTVQRHNDYPSSALVTVTGPGTADITMKLGDVEAKCTVEIPGIVLSTSGVLSMTNNRISMMVGQTEQLTIQNYGAAANNTSTRPVWWSSDASVVDAANGLLVARNPGTATVRVTRGNYSAECIVTVGEDTSALIYLSGSTPAGSPVSLSSIVSQLNSISQAKTGASLSYITNLSVSPSQGIVYNSYTSSADTGAGVGVTERYYPSGNGPTSLSALSFVSKGTFSGEASIAFTGCGNGTFFSGEIRVTVAGMSDVVYTTTSTTPVSFLTDDFNTVCRNRSGRDLRSISFPTLPSASVGTLYFNYTGASQNEMKVTANTQYYRTASPALELVSFVPSSGYEGTVNIPYRATDTSSTSYTGTVTIHVTRQASATGTADIYYSTTKTGQAQFQASDFNLACRRNLGENLSYVRFVPPASSDGTLFYNYRGFSSNGGTVNATTNYYYSSGSYTVGNVSFVPTTTTPARTAIRYTGYGVSGASFSGTVYVSLGTVDVQPTGGIQYTVFSGRTVSFLATDFNRASIAATGASLSYVRFSQVPAYTQGNLYHNYSANSSWNSPVYAGTDYYYNYNYGYQNRLSGITFQANQGYTGTVTLPFVGYNTNNVSFEGEVVIQVTPPAATDITFTATNASPIRLSGSRVASACSALLNQPVSYITITGLPSATSGRLYSNYTRFRTGTQVDTGTRFYYSGSPSIDQLSFVPRGRFQGEAVFTYTAVSTSGEQLSGRFVFNIVPPTSSSYFTDMGGHLWAASSVDYLYQNGVTNGVTSTTYGPNQPILRCDFVLMLCRAFGFSTTGSAGYSFADVPTNTYYAAAVATAKRLGIVNGDGVNFMPTAQITREDAMVMIKNAMDAAGWQTGAASTTILSRFPDSAAVSSYARNAVSVLVQLGAVNGDEYGRLTPQASITRAEAAVILHFVMTM